MTESVERGVPSKLSLMELSFTVNGERKTMRVYPMARLLDTFEGLAADGKLDNLQEAFLQCGGAQCGICTPGMILAASHLLHKKPEPTLEEIREGLSGNLCRCTGYTQIFEAVAEAARRRRIATP